MSEKVIGVYPLFNTGGICVHAIDYAEDKVPASVNGENPEWCEMAEKPQPEEDGSEMESGFLFGSFSCRSPGSYACESKTGGLT